MIILTDLSDVLIKGVYGVENTIRSSYGKEWAGMYLHRRLEIKHDFCKLMRGRLTEHGYWNGFMSQHEWPFDEQEIKQIFSTNFAMDIPGALNVYERISEYPETINVSAETQPGRPEIWIIADHIAERENELRTLHPEVFRLASKVFWSYQAQNLISDDGFLQEILYNNQIQREEVILVAKYERNLRAADDASIVSIRFDKTRQLERDLRGFGFRFQPKNKVNILK